APAATAWRANLALFVATAASVFVTGVAGFPHEGGLLGATALIQGAQFAGTILTILVAHELGHYVAARIHKVDASLPFFIPMPLVSPFGTMGAVIRMRGVIPTRRALLDIGAAGPLAGLAFALPLYAWGVAHSHFIPASTGDLVDLGESILIKGLDRAFAPAAPDGMLLVYSPVAFGAWGGFFITMINLLPVGQLDGGHVAYALFGPRQDHYAKLVHRSLLAFFCVIVVGHVSRDITAGRGLSATHVGAHISNAIFWLVWFQVLAVLGSLAARAREPSAAREAKEAEGDAGVLTIRTRLVATLGLLGLASLARSHPSWLVIGSFFGGLAILLAMEVKGGVLRKHDLLDHPPTGSEPLGPGRAAVAILTLALFALLFMPEPFSL
ncbi:MAG: site-2 protease family protein, partial [Labilithrix sp.]|nr:site-2 protease family protein [Labilithrix sp.]